MTLTLSDRVATLRTMRSWLATFYPGDTSAVLDVAAARLYDDVVTRGLPQSGITACNALHYARVQVRRLT